MSSPDSRPQRGLAAQAIGIALIAANLRPSLMGLGPLLKQIQAETGLSASVLGLLVTMPVIAFALVSPLAAPLARRFGLEAVLRASLVLLALGVALRSVPGGVALFGGAALLGAAIAVGNVLVPALIRRDFGRHIGPMTSVFVTLLAGVGAAGVGLAVPAATWLGWRGSLALWALPAAVAALWWLLQPARPALPATAAPAAAGAGGGSVWRSVLAWQVTLYMGLQSLQFYVLVAWLPVLLQDGGLSAARAGTHAFVYQLACLVGSMVAPLLAGRGRDQRPHTLVAAMLVLASYIGLVLSPHWLGWMVVGGIGSGASLALALAFFSLRSHSPLQTAALSGMAQSVGYGLAAFGPVSFGLLHDATGSWHAPLWVMCAVVVALAGCGLLAGRARRL